MTEPSDLDKFAKGVEQFGRAVLRLIWAMVCAVLVGVPVIWLTSWLLNW